MPTVKTCNINPTVQLEKKKCTQCQMIKKLYSISKYMFMIRQVSQYTVRILIFNYQKIHIHVHNRNV